MDAAEAKELFLSRSPVLWKNLVTGIEYEFPNINALIFRYIPGNSQPILQLELMDGGHVMIANPKQTRKKG